MEIKVQELHELLGLTIDDCIAVLRHFKWNQDKLQNQWFEKERVLKLEIGLVYDKSLDKSFPWIT